MQWERKEGFLKLGQGRGLISVSVSLGLSCGERHGGGKEEAREQIRSSLVAAGGTVKK